MQGGKAPTVKQEAWQKWQRERNCCNCSQPASIHHAVGTTAKHNKVHIGQWFTVALCYDCHQGDHGIHHDMSAFDEPVSSSRKEIEKRYFHSDALFYYLDTGNEIPIEAYEAIMDYHR